MAVARWIAETEAAQAEAERELREAKGHENPVFGDEEIAALVRKVDDLRIPGADQTPVSG